MVVVIEVDTMIETMETQEEVITVVERKVGVIEVEVVTEETLIEEAEEASTEEAEEVEDQVLVKEIHMETELIDGE
mgnify:CR=1 FL=1|tara:strand:+ start:651 stop:878 length:228 start_codon:yes stop_codon:yes gene_type:complete